MSSCILERLDMRLGIAGLRKKIENEINDSLYVFCGTNKNMIKIIETKADSTWLYQKKLKKGKFQWPEIGERTLIDKNQLIWIIEGISLVNKIERNSENQYYDFV